MHEKMPESVTCHPRDDRHASTPRTPEGSHPPSVQSPPAFDVPIRHRHILSILPFRKADRKTACRLYGESLGVIARERRKAQEFFDAVFRCNGFREKADLPHDPLPPLNLADEWARGDRMVEALFADLVRRSKRLAADSAAALRLMVEKERAGTARWPCPDSCEYVFHTRCLTEWAPAQERVSSRRIEGGTLHRTESDFQRTVRHVSHRHVLVEARKVPLPDSCVGYPERIARLIRLAPSWLPLSVIVGTQLQERLIERDVGAETLTVVSENVVYDPVDPALAVGDVVLTAWTQVEVEEEWRQRESRRKVEEERRSAEEEQQRQEERQAAELLERRNRGRLGRGITASVLAVAGLALGALAVWGVVLFWREVLVILLVLPGAALVGGVVAYLDGRHAS
jgi:hypothetical protein